MDKQTARQLIRARKKQMTVEEIKEKSNLIVERIGADSCFLQAETVYCYISYNQEVMTKPLILAAIQAGKKVAVPKVVGKEMEFFYIHSLDDVKPGYQGIEEPVGGELARTDKALMILPGLAFDKTGNRVGYGGGFYDRYLEKYQNTDFVKLAVAFDFQVLDALTMEACDWKVDSIVTENNWYRR